MIRYGSDNLLRLVAPTNTQDGTTITGGTCTARLYDDRKDSTLDADEATSQTTLSVANPALYEVDVDSVAVELDDDSIHDAGLVTARDLTAGTITVTTGLASAAAAGSRVMAKLGADIAMSEYGTPVVGATDWGRQGAIESTHADLALDQAVRIEITLSVSGVVSIHTSREIVGLGG